MKKAEGGAMYLLEAESNELENDVYAKLIK